MAALKLASSHNMVAFLDKSAESDGFEQIVDFLNAHPIKYALTVNPTNYTSCIEQFWTTTKVKTINGEVQIQALVDKKKVIITETSIRRDLQLADENGTECLPNATIFAELERMGGPTELVTNDTENVASVHTHSNDPLLSGEDRLKLNELMELCASLSQRVLDLENTKISQATEITELKKRVKKLEGKRKLSGGLMRKGGGRKKCLIHGILDGEEEFAEQDKEVAQKLQAQIDVELEEEEKLARQKEEDANIAKWDNAKDKGKAKMVEPEKPLKKKDQIMFDKEVAQQLQAQLDAELEEEEKLTRQREEDANIAE
ncbi:hypothetical protein Tco_0763637 [Tanacetum coccineum]